MTRLFEHVRQAHRDARTLPGIVADRCVHALVDSATCRACVDACPRNAWQLDDEQLAIDASRCDGCLQCTASCPQGAITGDLEPAWRRERDHGVVLFACERSTVTQGDGLIPCLHALGTARLLALYRAGARVLLTCAGACDECDRRPAVALAERLGQLNAMLDSRQLPPLTLRSLRARAWQQQLEQTGGGSPGSALSRREFFRRAVGTLVDPVAAAGTAPAAPGRHLPPPRAGEIVPVLPVIDGGRCNACAACARLCPHRAIAFDRAGPQHAIRVHPGDCSGCGICADVCDQDAVTLSRWTRLPADTGVPLRSARCRQCGNPFDYPAAEGDGQTLCRVCRQCGHGQRLFQVLA